eukprot:10132343-Ditylum_brightwellii.AAC.1
MEAETAGKAEDSVGGCSLFDKDESVELVENPYLLIEETGWAAARIYFEQYAKTSPGTILSQVGQWQNKWSLLVAHSKDLGNKLNDLKFAEETDRDEMDGILKELANTSKEIDKTIYYRHVAYNLYHKKGHYKNKASTVLNKKLSVKATPFDVEHICRGLTGCNLPWMCSARNGKTNSHAKHRTRYKMASALYLSLQNNNLLFPLPICQREFVDLESFTKLSDAKVSLNKTHDIRIKLLGKEKKRPGKLFTAS